jgi:hypothetical protein
MARVCQPARPTVCRSRPPPHILPGVSRFGAPSCSARLRFQATRARHAGTFLAIAGVSADKMSA